SDVETAYLNYCKRVIAYFHPDYFAMGIEVNLLRKNSGQTAWASYIAFHQHVYSALKALYPGLPIFVSLSGVPMLLGYETPPSEFSSAANPAQAYRSSQLAALSDILPSTDYFALSFYPYATAYYAGLFPTGYPPTMFDDLFSLSTKPIAIAETGYPGANIPLSTVTLPGSPTAQSAYLSALFSEAQKRSFAFVVNFVLRDYNQLCKSLGGCTDGELVWETTGLFDSSGTPRAGLQVFTQ